VDLANATLALARAAEQAADGLSKAEKLPRIYRAGDLRVPSLDHPDRAAWDAGIRRSLEARWANGGRLTETLADLHPLDLGDPSTLDPRRVALYREMLANGDAPPPVVVDHDGAVLQGRHAAAAFRAEGRDAVPALVRAPLAEVEPDPAQAVPGGAGLTKAFEVGGWEVLAKVDGGSVRGIPAPQGGKGYLYHVTTANRLASIGEHGLLPRGQGPASGFIGGDGGGYAGHSRGKTFWTAPSGARYWHGVAESFAFDQHDNPVAAGAVPVVLRARPKGVGQRFTDAPGKEDAGFPAYHAGAVPPEALEVYNGSSWVPVRGAAVDHTSGADAEGYLHSYHRSPLFPPELKPAPLDFTKGELPEFLRVCPDCGSKVTHKDGKLKEHLPKGSDLRTSPGPKPCSGSGKSADLKKGDLDKVDVAAVQHGVSSVAPTVIAHAAPVVASAWSAFRAKAKRGVAKAELEKMAIRDIPRGQQRPQTPEESENAHTPEFDYSHVLSPEHRANGYGLTVLNDGPDGDIAAHLHHNGKRVGEVYGDLQDYPGARGVSVHSDLRTEHRGQGLGTAMYEALYAHAYHNGVRRVYGHQHTDAAGGVHEALARKHGLAYSPEEPGEDSDFSRGKYGYQIKAEPGAGPAPDKKPGKPADPKPPKPDATGHLRNAHRGAVLPVGSTVNGEVKVRHQSGKVSWRGVRDGMISGTDPTPGLFSQVTHPVSARRPGST